MLMFIQILVKFCPFILNILSRNEILTSIKGLNSAANLQKMMLYNSNLDLINVNLIPRYYLCKCLYKIWSKFCPLDIERKRNSDIYQGL